MAANQRHPFTQFWDYLQSFDPNQRPHGDGVDRQPPPYSSGFPSGGRHPAYAPWAAASWAGPHGEPFPWGNPDSWEHWGRHGPHVDLPFRSPHDHREPRQQTPPTPTEEGSAAPRNVNDEKQPSPDTVMDDENVTAAPDPEEVAPEDSEDCGQPGGPSFWGRRGSRRCGRGERGERGHRGHRGGRGGRCGRGGPFGAPFGGPFGGPPHHHHPFARPHRGFPHHPPPYHGPHGAHPPPPPPPPPPFPPFDFSEMLQSLGNLGNHPFVENLRDHVQAFRDVQQQRARSGNNNNTGDEAETEAGDDTESFSPPIDIFNTPAAYILHVALPGAKKEDVGVNWDPDTSTLSIAGVVYRPGEEAFLQTLSTSERRVGLFDRSITLPPPGCEKEGEVDGLGISAKMEDGLLVVTVPKTEKEWTEIHKVDIE